jgi:hypothetical protein
MNPTPDSVVTPRGRSYWTRFRKGSLFVNVVYKIHIVQNIYLEGNIISKIDVMLEFLKLSSVVSM